MNTNCPPPNTFEVRLSPLAPVIFSILIALALTACGPSPSASTAQTPAAIRGELINPAQSPAAIAAVALPKPSEPRAISSAPDYTPVGFDQLASYNFEIDDTPFTNQTAAADKADGQIPARVKALNRKKVSIKGFMLPLKVSDGVVTDFLIMKDQSMCCYGNVPKINEWVSVKTTGPGVKPIMDQPISILGTLRVGALRENGYLVGIYQMDGDKLDANDH